MSAIASLAPIIRTVRGGAVMVDNRRHAHEALHALEGRDVLLDMEVDVRSEARCYRVYDLWENEICVIELGRVQNIGEAIGLGERVVAKTCEVCGHCKSTSEFRALPSGKRRSICMECAQKINARIE
ncbi:MAG: hypothetical protein JXK05_03945 [Campylobacterales bacterium]|nr:hypothetical protein [Campylobacterales bacterium]